MESTSYIDFYKEKKNVSLHFIMLLKNIFEKE